MASTAPPELLATACRAIASASRSLMLVAALLSGATEPPTAAAAQGPAAVEARASAGLGGRRAIGRPPSVSLRPGGRRLRIAKPPAPTGIASLLVVFQGPDPAVAGMSGDGDSIVANHPSGHPAALGDAVLWTLEDGETALTPDHEFSWARGISSDGSWLLGEWGLIKGPVLPFLWSPRDGFSFLTDGGTDFEGTPLGMSDNGRVLVGVVNDRDDVRRAWTWSEENGLVRLPSPFPGGGWCVARDVSDDGRVVVGSCGTPFVDAATPSERAAVRWEVGSPPTVLQMSGPLSRVLLDPPCHAQAVSRDGSVTVGGCRGAARRWGSTGRSGLDSPAQGWTEASGSTPDGRVIVGTWTEDPQLVGIPRNDPHTMSAVVWLPSGEMRRLSDLLEDFGLRTELAQWQRLATARAVSDDGRVIAGTGVLDPQGDTQVRGVYRAELSYVPGGRVPVR